MLQCIRFSISIFGIFLFFNLQAKPKILFLGDSLTQGYGLTKEQAHPAIIREKLHLEIDPQIVVVNAGINGSTTASSYKRLLWHLKDKPDILVLSLGANDGLRGISIDSIKVNLQKTIDLAQQYQIKVLLTGMLMPPNYGKKYRTEFREIFYQLAKKNDITFMPFLLKDVVAHPELNLPDGIHPNEKGQKIIAQKLYPYLLPLVNEIRNAKPE